jgi:O-antigen/teichoic acid export membrane protein
MNNSQSRFAALKAAALIATSTYVTTALGLLVSVFIARTLGPHDYGQYAYLLWLSGLLVVFGNHGLGISGIRFISESLGRQDAQEARNVHGWLQRQQRLSLVLVLGAFALIAVLWPPAGWQGSLALLLGVIAVSVVSKVFFLFDVSMAKGYSQYSVEAVSNMVMSLLYTGGVATLAWLHASLTSFALFFAVISAGHIVVVKRQLAKAGISAGHQAPSNELLARIKPHLWWTIILVVVATLSNKTIETFLLSALIGPAEVGYFSIASALTKGGIDLLSSSLTTMLMPMMAHAYGAGGMRKVNEILSDSVRYFLFMGLVLAGLGTLWSALGISLMYGDRYEPVVNVLRVMVLIGGLTLSEGAFGALLSTTDHQKLRAGMAAASVGISALTSVLLVPAYGLKGAVIAHAVTRVLVVLIMGGGITRMLAVTLPLRDIARLLGCAMLAALCTLPLLWLSTSVWMQFAAGIVYVLAFIPATMWLKAWHAKDAHMLVALLERKPALFGVLTPFMSRWARSLD